MHAKLLLASVSRLHLRNEQDCCRKQSPWKRWGLRICRPARALHQMLSAVLGVPCPKQALCHILLGLGILEHCSDTDTSPLHVLVIFQVVFAFFLGGWMFFRSSLTCVLEQSPCNSCGLLGTRMCPPSSGQERWASNCAHHTQNCTESAVLMASVIQGSWTQIRAVNSWRRVLSAGRCVTSKKGGWFHQSV